MGSRSLLEVVEISSLRLLPFFISFLLGLILTPIFRRVALRSGIVDIPDSTKIHDKEISYLGGLSFFFSFLITVFFFRRLYVSDDGELYQLAGILLGAVVIIILGLEDDVRSLNAWEKLSGQIVASLILCLFGFRIENLTNPAGGAFTVDVLSIPLTVFWVVLIINAVNLIDGLDGLAGGVILLSSFTLLCIASYNGNVFIIFLLMCFMGGLLGFLKYNFYPASIFMGDTGSMFLGFFIASVTMIGNWKKATATTLLVPLLAIGVPIFDTFVAFIRRGMKGKHPFKRDTSHLHHRLLRLGLSHKQVVLLLYAITFLFGWTAFLLVFIEDSLAIVVLLLIASLILLGIETLQFIEKRVTIVKPEEKSPKIINIAKKINSD